MIFEIMDTRSGEIWSVSGENLNQAVASLGPAVYADWTHSPEFFHWVACH